MTAGTKTIVKILSYSKYLGLGLILVGIPTILLDSSDGSEMPLLVGLFTLLISISHNEDERSVQIKTTSLYFSFMISYAAKLIISNLHDNGLTAFELVEINHFLILVLALANIIYFGRMHIIKQ